MLELYLCGILEEKLLTDSKDSSKFIGRLVKTLELTSEEIEEIKNVYRSPGWKIICEKVWAKDQIQALLFCQTSVDENNSFNSGLYEGIVYAEKSIEIAADPSKKRIQPRPQAKRLQRNIGSHDIEPKYHSGSNPL